MCDYCEGEGCICGSSNSETRGECEATILGKETCSACGCQAKPWWSDVEIPGPDGMADALSDLNSSTDFFPAPKEKVVRQGVSEDSPEAQWLSANLPAGTYRDPGEIVSALARGMPPARWEQAPTDLFLRSQARVTLPGRKLTVAGGQAAVMVAANGKVCDEFAPGEHTVTMSNCPLLAAQSRKTVPGFEHPVLDGSPLFYSPSMEFEVSLTTMGQTKALRKVMATGVARVKLSKPGPFFEQVAKDARSTQDALNSLRKYCDESLKKLMVAHEMEELTEKKDDLLAKPLSDTLSAAGLSPVRVSLDSVGEMGPGAFLRPGGGAPGQPPDMEKMRQMAEAMRAGQMAQMQNIQMMREQMMAQQAAARQTMAQSPPILCASCGTSNPASTKFCGNCGKPLRPPQRACPKCGKVSAPGVKFCGACGTKLPE